MASIPKIGGIHVDIEALMSISHECDPKLCAGEVSCCASYDVQVSNEQLQKIEGVFPIAAKYRTDLNDSGEFLNVFDPLNAKESAIDADEDNLCAFAYDCGKSRILCSLHSAALDIGERPVDIKPISCSLWPLALTDPPGRTLTVDDDAFSFPCNKKRRKSKKMHRGIETIIIDVFGLEFSRKVNHV